MRDMAAYGVDGCFWRYGGVYFAFLGAGTCKMVRLAADLWCQRRELEIDQPEERCRADAVLIGVVTGIESR